MSPNDKGVFPSWIDDEEIISQLLKKMLSEDGKICYSYIINPEHDTATRERMKRIVKRMEQDQLISPLSEKTGDIEIGLNGTRAVFIGYRKFKRKNRWDLLSSKFSVIFFRLVLVGGGTALLYLLLHHFKII